jgi:hypothetical protein
VLGHGLDRDHGEHTSRRAASPRDGAAHRRQRQGR